MQDVKVYTANICPFCTAAKTLLKSKDIPFEEINLDSDIELRMKLSEENNGWRTVPMIFIGDTFIGGFDELNKLNSNGKLTEMVNQG